MTMNKFLYSELKKFLQSKLINIESTISDNSYFLGISSLKIANENNLTFFHNNKYIDSLSLTKAKACFITKEHSKLLNKLCTPIIVNDPYFAYALTTNFYSLNKNLMVLLILIQILMTQQLLVKVFRLITMYL